MISIVNYLFEGKMLEHLKQNKGKYAAGIGGAVALGAGLTSGPYHDWQVGRHIDNAINAEPRSANELPIVKKITHSIGKFGLQNAPDSKLKEWINSPVAPTDEKFAKHMRAAAQHELDRRNSWTNKL